MKSIKGLLLAVLTRIAIFGFCFACLAGWGCTGPIYEHSGSSSVSPYTAWHVTGELDGVAKAVDDNVSTAAVSKSYYLNHGLTLDLGKPCLFNMVVLDHGSNENGYCRRVGLWTSMDGRNFSYVYAAPGTRRVTTINWVTPVLARYIRIQAIMPGDRPWSIAEIYVR